MKFRFSIIFGLSLSWLLISNANAACNYKLDSLYFPFPDSLKLKSLFVYRVNTENMAPEFSEYDTTLFGAQNVFALTRYSVGSIGTGNNGGAIEAIDYFLRPEDVSFLFIRNFIPYMFLSGPFLVRCYRFYPFSHLGKRFDHCENHRMFVV